jgi:S-adenosylmethionine:tRNA ribosyltransferase-isomerase
LQVSDFYYELPEERIAQEPPAERGASRMLVVSRQKQSFHDDTFRNFSKYIRPGDCLILNNTRVLAARLHGRRNSKSGAEVEVLLLRAQNDEETIWECLVKPGKRVRSGDHILFDEDVKGEVLSQGEFGERTLRFSPRKPMGETPLPPYIHRKPDAKDRERYQTVFASQSGSAAAPTAGLHLTTEILAECQAAGAEIAQVTLHVGLGTFAPLRDENLSDIRLHQEHFEISAADAAIIHRAKRRLCVGTTSVRTIETAMLRGLAAMQGETSLFIHPGFSFRGTDALLTNFHLPRSSLLILVSAFAGRELILAAYLHAVAAQYRFFSYGDCMLIE